ncbi:EcsC family protein [Paenibacillus sp. YIM B09110]|uniref:EcsC family protein n=1 Tax=Paenibacillus sp. YIM B09110 TaxID=3126102 RepID=UPI00301E0926
MPIVSDSNERLLEALREIEAWENDQKDLWFWEKLGRLPFMLLDKLTPKFIQAKLGQAVDEVGGFIQNGGKYLVSEKTITSKLARNAEAVEMDASLSGSDVVLTVEDCASLPLAVMDRTAAELKSSRTAMATVQGATTGIGGIFTLAIDIPAILGLSLKIIQEIAICYGYNPKLKEERIFAVKVMQFASSDIVGKKAILDELIAYGTESEGQGSHMLSQLQGWREVVNVYRDNFGLKKLFQLIPIAGIVFGAFINRSTLNDVAEAATMLYRKRRVLVKLKEGGGSAT